MTGINTNIAATIDHTILGVQTSRVDVEKLCQEALKYGFAAICVPPYYLEQAVNSLKNTNIGIATVIGFPMGYSTTAAKITEMKLAIKAGANELDVVVNLCAVKNQDWTFVVQEIGQLTQLTKSENVILKVILETALWSDETVIHLCDICAEAGVDFVKTSTGFHGVGASLDVIKLMRKTLPKNIKIKASGGIRTQDFALDLMTAGADRLGCSKGVAIVTL